MKRLQEETMCKMAVLGRGSMRDRQKVNNVCVCYYSLLMIILYIKRMFCPFFTLGRGMSYFLGSEVCTSY